MVCAAILSTLLICKLPVLTAIANASVLTAIANRDTATQREWNVDVRKIRISWGMRWRREKPRLRRVPGSARKCTHARFAPKTIEIYVNPMKSSGMSSRCPWALSPPIANRIVERSRCDIQKPYRKLRKRRAGVAKSPSWPRKAPTVWD